MAIQERIVNGTFTEIYVNGGGNFITQSRPTHFHQFCRRRILTASESMDDFKEVTKAEKTALEESDARWKEPSEELIAQAETAFATYNRSTGFFELNGLTDITEQEMRDILQWGSYSTQMIVGKATASHYSMFAYAAIRTTLPSVPKTFLTKPVYPQLVWCHNFEIIRFGIRLTEYNTCAVFDLKSNLPLYGARRLREISDYLTPSIPVYIGGSIDTSYIYNPLLETIYLWNLAHNTNMPSLPALSLASIRFAVENAANTSPITITLHPDAYARVTDELFTLATAKQITIATTE